MSNTATTGRTAIERAGFETFTRSACGISKVTITRTKGRRVFWAFFSGEGADFCWNIIPGRFGLCLTFHA